MIKNVVTHIAGLLGATVGQDLFAIWEQPGALMPRAVFNERAGTTNFSGMRTQMVQVLTVGADPFQSRDFAYRIHNSIERKSNITMGTTEVFFIDPIGPPMLLGRDPQGNWEFTANYLFRVKDSTF